MIRRATIALLCCALCCACAPAAKGAASPAECVRAMSAHARAGETDAYLNCFTGALRESLDQARRDAGPEAFAESLRARMAAVRGMAISEEKNEQPGTATLRIEWVFDDRNEVQFLTLRQEGGAWRIAAMKEAQYTLPEIPYGTEVF